MPPVAKLTLALFQRGFRVPSDILEQALNETGMILVENASASVQCHLANHFSLSQQMADN